MQGTSHEYLLDRLRREGHADWLEAIESGRVSAFAVACELGWVTRSPTLLGERAGQTKRRRHRLAEERQRMASGGPQLDVGKLSSDQRTFLLYGPRDAYDDAFADEAAVLAAWEKHREELLAACPRGRRPWGWRAIDHPEIVWKGYDRERSGLWRAGVLGAEERIELEAEWRRDFDRGQKSDVPVELVRRWKAERRQQKLSRLNKEKAPSAIAEGAQ
jgi:hypothetical protein